MTISKTKISQKQETTNLDGEKPQYFVPREEFEKACIEALTCGMFKRSFLFYLKGKTKDKDARLASDAPSSLIFYNLVVTISEYVASIRLDHALTFLKLNGRKNDYYGEEILGACIRYSQSNRMPEWRFVYFISEDGKIKERNLGSTDHVIARSKGGADRLYNMQLMRCRSNWKKADADSAIFVDVDDTKRVLNMLNIGIHNMKTPNKKSCSVKEELTSLLQLEFIALDEFEIFNDSKVMRSQ